MTSTRIRELLVDLADTLDAPDLAAAAWHDARRRQVRHRVALVSAATAVTVVAGVATGTHLVSGPDHTIAGTSSPVPTTAQHLSDPRIQRAPSLAEEASLPRQSLGVPATIPLDPSAPDVEQHPIPAARMAFGLLADDPEGRVHALILVAADGTQRTLDISELAPAPDAVNGATPFVATSLSPDGTRLAFGQSGEVAVFSLATMSWSHFTLPEVADADTATPYWQGNRTLRAGPVAVDVDTGTRVSITTVPVSPPAGVRFSDTWGPQRYSASGSRAQAGFLTSPTVVGDASPEGIGAESTTGGEAVLVMPHVSGQERYKGCCAVAGWRDDATVVYESRFGTGTAGQVTRLLTWNVRTGEVRLGATVIGDLASTFVSSYADFAG
jgi:hypothetical protein